MNIEKHRRLGITLVELVITICFLSITVSVLLPAVQNLREASRIQTCDKRLARIGFEAIEYESIHCFYPCQVGAPGGVNRDDFTSGTNTNSWLFQQSTSPMALAATTTEEFNIDPVFFNLDVNLRSNSQRFWEMKGWDEITKEQRRRYRCPTANVSGNAIPSERVYLSIQPVVVSQTDWDIIQTVSATGPFTPENEIGRTNFAGCLGASTGGALRNFNRAWYFRGMISSREKISLQQVSVADGVSNSILFGETIGTLKREGRNVTLTHTLSWFSGGVAFGAANVDFGMDGEPGPGNLPLGNALRSRAYGFGSFHREGVNFVKGDGSTIRLSHSVDVDTFYALCGAFDTQ